MRIKKSIKTSSAPPEAPPTTDKDGKPHWAYLAGLHNRDDSTRRHWTGEQLAQQHHYQPGLPRDVI